MQQPPGSRQPPADLRERLFEQTSARLRKPRWRRWPLVVGAAAAIVLALVSGYVGLRLYHVDRVRGLGVQDVVEVNPAPEPQPPPVIETPVHPLVLENMALDAESDLWRAASAEYFQAGDLYFEQNQDIESALRCYHQALAYCDARELEVDVNDNYLVMGLKRERRKGE